MLEGGILMTMTYVLLFFIMVLAALYVVSEKPSYGFAVSYYVFSPTEPKTDDNGYDDKKGENICNMMAPPPAGGPFGGFGGYGAPPPAHGGYAAFSAPVAPMIPGAPIGGRYSFVAPGHPGFHGYHMPGLHAYYYSGPFFGRYGGYGPNYGMLHPTGIYYGRPLFGVFNYGYYPGSEYAGYRRMFGGYHSPTYTRSVREPIDFRKYRVYRPIRPSTSTAAASGNGASDNTQAVATVRSVRSIRPVSSNTPPTQEKYTVRSVRPVFDSASTPTSSRQHACSAAVAAPKENFLQRIWYYIGF